MVVHWGSGLNSLPNPYQQIIFARILPRFRSNFVEISNSQYDGKKNKSTGIKFIYSSPSDIYFWSASISIKINQNLLFVNFSSWKLDYFCNSRQDKVQITLTHYQVNDDVVHAIIARPPCDEKVLQNFRNNRKIDERQT